MYPTLRLGKETHTAQTSVVARSAAGCGQVPSAHACAPSVGAREASGRTTREPRVAEASDRDICLPCARYGYSWTPSTSPSCSDGGFSDRATIDRAMAK